MTTHKAYPKDMLTVGDLAYVLSRRGSWDGLRVAVVGTKGNIARSWAEAARVLPMDLIQIAPPGMALTAEDMLPNVSVANDLEAAADAHLIVTDCWPADASAPDCAALAQLRIDAPFLDACRSDAMFIPCPPVTRNEEVTAHAMQHPKCVATAAKAFLMHVQNAFAEQARASR